MATNDSSFAYSIDQAQRLFGKGLEVVGSRTGIESLFNYGKEVVAQQDRDIKEGNYQPQYTTGLREAYQQGGLGDAIGWVAEKTGENIATSGFALGGGLASALTAPFSVPAAALIGGATIVGSGILGTGEVAEEMEQKTGSYNDSVAIGAGTIIALLDRFGAGRVIPRDELLTITGKDLIKRLGQEGKLDAAREIGKRIGKSVAFEGGTEGLQEGVVMGSTALTGGEYTGEQIADRLLEGVVLGGTMGGGFRATLEAAGRSPDAYAGIKSLVGDIFSGEGTMSPSMQLAIQSASNLSSPYQARRLEMSPVPRTDAEILMSEAAGQGGSSQLTVKEKVAENLDIESDEDPNLDENQSFFSKDLKGGSVGNRFVQAIALDELRAIEQDAEAKAKEEEASFPSDYVVTETDKQRIEIDKKNRIKDGILKAKNRERLQDADDPVVSPLRIKLVKFADQVGLKKPIDVSRLYEHLRSQDTNREGSVGFIAKVETDTVESQEIRYKPKDDLTPDQKKEFGQLIKSAPKIKTPLLDDNGKALLDKKGNPRIKETPDFDAVPRIKELGNRFDVPVFAKKLTAKFDNESAGRDKLTHFKGGEAFTSGLEEYLARNYNEQKTMEEVIHEFDRMRPTVRLEVRSKKNLNLRDQAPFTNAPLAAGDILANPDLAPAGTIPAETGYSGQRIFTSFSIGNTPVYDESTLTRNRNAGDPKDYQIDSISIVAKNPDQERMAGGNMANSPILRTLQQKKGSSTRSLEGDLDRIAESPQGSATKELGYPSGHDYYNKGFGYVRGMVVEGTDGKLYVILEENQSDVTRTYENLLDFSKPEYDLALKLGGVPDLLSGSIDLALAGNDPYLTRKAALLGGTSLGGTNFSDKRKVKNLGRTRDHNIDTHKLFTPSEKNKINVLDEMDQNMPETDAPSQFDADLKERKIKFDAAVKSLNEVSDRINKNQFTIDNFTLTERAPQELEKFAEIGLEDLLKFRKEAIPRMKKFFNLRRRTNLTAPGSGLSAAEQDNIIFNSPNTMEGRRAAEAEIQRLQQGSTVPKKISFRQRKNEKLNGLDEIVERTLFSTRDFEDFYDLLKERFDNADIDDESLQNGFDGILASESDPFRVVSEGRLQFPNEMVQNVASPYRGQDYRDLMRLKEAPAIAKDTFGREIIRLFNEMAGFRDGINDNAYRQTITPSSARFRDKYQRYGDAPNDNSFSPLGYSYDGLVLPNKFMAGSVNDRRAFELGHRLSNPQRFGSHLNSRANRNIEQYESGKDAFSLLLKHMPFASTQSGNNNEVYPQRRRAVGIDETSINDIRPSQQQLEADQINLRQSDQPGFTGDLSTDRDYTKYSLTYDMGRSEEDQKQTRPGSTFREYEADPVDRIREDASNLLAEMTEGKADYSYFDGYESFRENVFREDSPRPESQGFYGKVREGDEEFARDAMEKALNLAVSDATYEAVNEKALDVIKHKVASAMARKHKDAIEQIDLAHIMESSLNNNYRLPDDLSIVSDSLGFVVGNPGQVDYENVTQRIKDALPTNAIRDAEKALSKAIDDVSDKIGFVPEDGNYKKYMSLIDFERSTEEGRAMVEKYSKKLGLNNPDKLKKKLLMNSILDRAHIDPQGRSFRREGTTRRQVIEASMNPLQRFMGATDKQAKDFFIMEKKLQPIGYENRHHNTEGVMFEPDPRLGNFFQLLTSQAYRGFMQGDKERAEALGKEQDSLVYQRMEAMKQKSENEVASDQDGEIDRRFNLLAQHIEDNADKYNYSPEELKAAMKRLREHVTQRDKKYIRAPHNANETQTARGLLHSLIHKVTDPRFEQLYGGRKIEGIVLPHRKDLYLPRALEDSRVRDPNTFGMGTYGSVIQDILERFEAAGAGVDRDRIFEMKRATTDPGPVASLNRPVQGVIDLSEGSIGRRLAEGKFTFRAKGGYIDLRRKAS